MVAILKHSLISCHVMKACFNTSSRTRRTRLSQGALRSASPAPPPKGALSRIEKPVPRRLGRAQRSPTFAGHRGVGLPSSAQPTKLLRRSPQPPAAATDLRSGAGAGCRGGWRGFERVLNSQIAFFEAVRRLDQNVQVSTWAEQPA